MTLNFLNRDSYSYPYHSVSMYVVMKNTRGFSYIVSLEAVKQSLAVNKVGMFLFSAL